MTKLILNNEMYVDADIVPLETESLSLVRIKGTGVAIVGALVGTRFTGMFTEHVNNISDLVELAKTVDWLVSTTTV